MYNFYSKSGVVVGVACLLSNFSISAKEALLVYELEEYVVSSGPLPRSVDDFASPFTALDEGDVRGSSAASLGDLLDGQLGVTASSFTAGASRPVIRGFEGPRVRILQDGIEALDASDTSPDHGVAVEPLLIERVEVLRGPSTLLYGGSAIGGVVNVIGREIPAEAGQGQLTGAVEFRADTAARSESAMGYAQFGGDQWAIGVTGLKREADDYEIPGSANVDGSGSRDHLENSFVESDQSSIGGAWFFTETKRLGFAYSLYESQYGIPGEDVSIDLDRDRFDLELDVQDLDGWIEALRVRAGYTDYQHEELEGSEVGTVFEREGWELRAEAAHAEWGIIDEGIFGAQINDTDSSAIGDEAFTPPATTQSQAVFISEHRHHGDFHYELGARIERQTVSAETSSSDYSDIALSVATSVIWNLDEANSISLSLQRSQRHPNSTELYARGPHLATSQYELGDVELDLETVYGADLSFRTEQGKWNASFSVFYYAFEDYIFAENLGYRTDIAGITEGSVGFDASEALDTYQFGAVDASFLGFEVECYSTIYQSDGLVLDFSLMADYVEAENDDTGDSLPRIPPVRVGGGLNLTYLSWEFGTELRFAFEQDDLAPFETKTDGYTEWNVDASKRFDLSSGRSWVLFMKASNLLNEEIRSHTSFLKDSVPLPGRNFLAGVRFEF